jgi:hypothetical protein
LSPSFPLNREQPFRQLPSLTAIAVIEPVDFDQTWPSSYADGGRVSWSKVHAEEDHTVIVSFPNIRSVYVMSTLHIFTVLSQLERTPSDRRMGRTTASHSTKNILDPFPTTG